jgi:hypothetical protein
MLNSATTAELRLDVPQGAASSPIVRHGYVSLTQWIAVLVAADITGIALVAVLDFRLYASPLDYRNGQLWAGLGSVLIGWIVASWRQNLYSRKTLLSGAKVHSLNGLVAR